MIEERYEGEIGLPIVPLSRIKALNPRFKGGELGTILGFPASGHTHNNTITLQLYKHRLEVFKDWLTPQGAHLL